MNRLWAFLLLCTPMLGQVISDGNGYYTRWLSSDGTKLFASAGTGLYSSTDAGACFVTNTCTTIVVRGSGTFPTAVQAVRQMANGELIVGTGANGMVSPGCLYISSGYPTLGSGASWTQVQCASSYNYFTNEWGISTYQNIVVACEYGAKDGVNTARYTYFSTNSGATFAKIFDLGTTNQEHLHGCMYDPWWKAVWQNNGDTDSRIRVTFDPTDANPIWTVVNPGSPYTQMTSIVTMPNVILFLSDGYPNAVYRIVRTGYQTYSFPTVAYELTTDSTPAVYVGTLGFWLNNNPANPVLLPFEASGYGTTVAATWDGYNFRNLWTDSYTGYSAAGLLTTLGPVNNSLVGTIVGDSRYASGTTLLTLPNPTGQAGGPIVQGGILQGMIMQ